MTCTAGARRVDVIVPRTPRCSGIFGEWLCALKLLPRIVFGVDEFYFQDFIQE